MPGKRLPIVIALVELPEGVRVMAELTGAEGKDGTTGGVGALKFALKGYSPMKKMTN